MSPADLTQLLVTLYRGTTGAEPPEEVVAAIDEEREDNGLDAEHGVPAWLTAAFEAVIERRPADKVLFSDDGGDLASFLRAVSRKIPGWKHDSQGEHVSMKFPAFGMEIYLSNEALTPDGRHSSSCTARRLPS